ncbi:hypothetical protein ACHAPT_001344 [Fusarium lateritium]
MSALYENKLYSRTKQGKVCTAFGVKLVASPLIPQFARQAGYDSLFIDLEHSSLSLSDASLLCNSALPLGVTPIVRVPYQCGDGFVQRVMDGGAMGVVFPHVRNKNDAEAAVRIAKYPPAGSRSMMGQLPVFSTDPVPVPSVVEQTNKQGSAVLLMVETVEAVQNIDGIAAVQGIDVLLIGSNDLSIELGVPAQFKSDKYCSAVEAVSKACKKHGKIFGFAGVYENAEIQGWVINELGARYSLVNQDSVWIAKGAKASKDALELVSAHVK